MPLVSGNPFSTSDNPFAPKQKRQRSAIQEELDVSRHQEPGPLEDQTLLGSIGHATLSGLSRVGNVLDLPGSMVRDVATFHNPFDQLLSPTTSENRTSGRDLLRETGLAGHDDTYGNWWGGLGAELLLDPLTYVGVGALTKAGKAAQAGGKLTKGLAPSIKAGERSLLSVGLPFTEHATHVGTGPTAQKFASYLDTAAGAVANSPPGRMVQGLFNPEVMGQFGPLGQSIAKMMHPARQEAAQKTAEQVSQFVDPIRQTRQAFTDSFEADILASPTALKAGNPGLHAAKISEDYTNHVFERLFGLQAELGGDIDRAMSLFDLDPAKLTPALRQQFTGLADDMQTAAKAINESALKKGGWGGVLNTPEEFEHFARYAKMTDTDYAQAAREFQTIRGSSAHRSDLLGLIPEEIVNRLATDTLARAKDDADALRAAGHIVQQYGSFLGKGSMLDDAGKTVPRWGGIGEHALALTQWANEHPLKAIFLNPKIEDFARYMRQAHIADSTMDVVHELAARNAGALAAGVDLTQMPTAARKVSLPDFYEKFARMRSKESLEYLATKTGKSVDELKKLAIPHEVALAVQATRNFQDDPRWLGAIGDALDGFTSLWKQAVTLPFPSFAGRNLGSGQYVNASSGLMPTFAHLSNYFQHVREAFGMLRSGIDPVLERELMTYDVFNPRQLSEGVEGGLYAKYASAHPANPLDWRSTWDEAGQIVNNAGTPGDALNAVAGRSVPFADRIPSLTGARQVGQFALGTGAKVNQWVEFLNRVPMYKYLRSQGWDAAQAAKKVKELQIDYGKSNYAPFETQVVSRMVPFYKFQRGVAPVILQNLLQRPGGLMGATIRAARLAGGNDPSLPDYVQETMAVENPFKQPTDGTRSFLTGFGLPFENLFAYGGGGVRGAGREVLSQLNPLVKAPLEWSTNQSFFQRGPNGAGRPLDDLNPTVGQTISNIANRFGADMHGPAPTPRSLEFLLANSPLSRFLTTARQLSDPRKSPLDLLLANTTGVRVTDVSPAAQDAILKDRAGQIMRSMDAKSFEKIYFRPQELDAMSPEDRAKAQRLMQLQDALASRAKDRIKQKKAAAQNMQTASLP